MIVLIQLLHTWKTTWQGSNFDYWLLSVKCCNKQREDLRAMRFVWFNSGLRAVHVKLHVIHVKYAKVPLHQLENLAVDRHNAILLFQFLFVFWGSECKFFLLKQILSQRDFVYMEANKYSITVVTQERTQSRSSAFPRLQKNNRLGTNNDKTQWNICNNRI